MADDKLADLIRIKEQLFQAADKAYAAMIISPRDRDLQKAYKDAVSDLKDAIEAIRQYRGF